MFAPRCRTDLQVGREIVTPFVLRKVGLARRIPSSEADVADALGRQDLLAMIMLRLGDKDVFKGLRPGLGPGLLGCLGHCLYGLYLCDLRELEDEHRSVMISLARLGRGNSLVSD